MSENSKAVFPPSLPSNLDGESEQDVIFNSIGFYGDLLGRLDGQINMTEEIYKQSFFRVAEHNSMQTMNHSLIEAQMRQRIKK